jgi:hypothetical protein
MPKLWGVVGQTTDQHLANLFLSTGNLCLGRQLRDSPKAEMWRRKLGLVDEPNLRQRFARIAHEERAERIVAAQQLVGRNKRSALRHPEGHTVVQCASLIAPYFTA